ncbi:hypothetical protein MN608_03519 [Microdochium nivale]|nr:hypothetical protein MN608_03519 [Microdochium nivale]
MASSNSSASTQRERPPHIEELNLESNRIPLKPARVSKMESKLNLRKIFSRQKPKRDVIPEFGAPILESPTSPGSSTLTTDALYLPYASATSLSLHALQYPESPAPSFLSGEEPGRPQTGRCTSIIDDEQMQVGISSMPWPPPPFLEAYQQAVKRAMMSMCTVPTETLERISSAAADGSSTRKTSDASTMGDSNKRSDTRRRLNRNTAARSPLDFTSKIYVLTTSGWLFQYAADGEDDRPPERALRITKNSAAFASDLIPGRHWVIQVLSEADTAGAANTTSKGRKSKHKDAEKRQVSNFLLVCETPDDMESWLAALRQEIEVLGGRKKVSETGEILNNSDTKIGVSQGDLVSPEQARYSRIIRQDLSWNQESALGIDGLERTPDLLQDDESTTASLVSSEGHNLESLRDSNGNRYSMAFGTPPNSSPACSPTRPSFPSYTHEAYALDQLAKIPGSSLGAPEVRARPNATAIMDRRQSRLAENGDLDIYSANGRRQSMDLTRRDSAEHEYISGPQSFPNFSIPQAVSRRFSVGQTAFITINQTKPASPTQAESSRSSQDSSRSVRKAPPTALPLSRPLSVVIDLPSPIGPSLSPVALTHDLTTNLNVAIAGSGSAVPRRFVSLTNLRNQQQPNGQAVAETLPLRLNPAKAVGRNRGLSHTVGYFTPPTANTQRSPMSVEVSHPPNSQHSMIGEPFSLDAALHAQQYNHFEPPAPASDAHQQPRYPVQAGRILTSQRSMSVLAGMPPPAPPPTCALPPVPPMHAPPNCALPPIPVKAAKRQLQVRTVTINQTVAA